MTTNTILQDFLKTSVGREHDGLPPAAPEFDDFRGHPLSTTPTLVLDNGFLVFRVDIDDMSWSMVYTPEGRWLGLLTEFQDFDDYIVWADLPDGTESRDNDWPEEMVKGWDAWEDPEAVKLLIKKLGVTT